MKFIINFGHDGTKKEVFWYKDLMEFPKLIRFQGAKWQWVMYNQVGKEYELTFSQMPIYNPDYYADIPSFEDMFGHEGNDKCVCGSIFTSFGWDHMRYCSKWKPWDKL